MGALSLTSDFEDPVQGHLDELAIRMGRVLFGVIFTTAIVAYFSASIILWYLEILSPCPPTECLRIYKPTDWMATRWLSALLISIIIMLPLFSREIYLFSYRGLLPSERRWLAWILLSGPLIGLVVVISTLIWFLPYGYQLSHDSGLISGVEARYGAVDMIRFALVLAGVELVILLAVLSALLSISFKLLDKSNVMWWRFRIHGPSFLFIWLLVPLEFEGMFFLCFCTELLLVELLIFFPSKSNVRISSLPYGRGILDSEARLRRIGIVGCGCCDVVTVPTISSIPSGMAYFPSPNFCNSHSEQDCIIENVVQMKLTDLLITGCDSSIISPNLVKSLERLNCEIRTLSLIDFNSMRTTEMLVSDIDFQIRLAVENDPWKSDSVFERVYSLLSDIDIDSRPNIAYWTTLHKPPFGTNLQTDEVLLTSVFEPDSDVISKFNDIGVRMYTLHNYLTNN